MKDLLGSATEATAVASGPADRAIAFGGRLVEGEAAGVRRCPHVRHAEQGEDLLDGTVLPGRAVDGGEHGASESAAIVEDQGGVRVRRVRIHAHLTQRIPQPGAGAQRHLALRETGHRARTSTCPRSLISWPPSRDVVPEARQLAPCWLREACPSPGHRNGPGGATALGPAAARSDAA